MVKSSYAYIVINRQTTYLYFIVCFFVYFPHNYDFPEQKEASFNQTHFIIQKRGEKHVFLIIWSMHLLPVTIW